MSQKSKKTQVTAWAISDPGSRNHNEDAFLILKSSRQHVIAVCDGMGGHAAGEVASGLAVETIKEFFTAREKAGGDSRSPEEVVFASIDHANRSIFADAQANPSRDGMGSTCVVALIRGDQLYLGHVGDSRAYLVRGGGIRQLTRDHSFVEEMVKAGMITPHETHSNPQRNVILQSLGRSENVNIEVSEQSVRLQAGDYVLLCSDGLTAVVADQEIAEYVENLSAPKTACEELVKLTNRRGAPDNVTVAILRYEGEVDEGPPVAVISSDMDSVGLFRLVLKREGFRVKHYTHAEFEEVFKTSAKDRPRLLVVDHHSDSQAVLEMCKNLGNAESTMGTPTILVTDGSISVEQGRQAGASRVLMNSSLLSELTPAVRLLMEESTALIYILEEVAGRTEKLARELRAQGFLVVPHSSPAALKSAAEQQVPRMLILDITRGVERLCQTFKTDPATASCPIVLTAEGAVANPREAHQLGADYYLTRARDTVMLANMLLNK